jgi:VanZ family protein
MKKIQSAPGHWRLIAIALLYLAIFISIMIMAYTNHLPTYLAKIPNYDKAGHVLLYALAAYFGHRIWRSRSWPCLGWRFPLFPMGFALFTVVEELIQNLSPYRTLDSLDLIASMVGILIGWQLAERSLQTPQQKPPR